MHRFESWNMKFKNKMLFQDIVLGQVLNDNRKTKKFFFFFYELDSVEKDCCRISHLDRVTSKQKKIPLWI